MANVKRWQATAALLLTLSTQGAIAAPALVAVLAPEPAYAQARSFSDVPSGHWAGGFIDALAARGVISGFPDGSFRPEAPVTRAQFASMLSAFNKARVRNAVNFSDVPVGYWGTNAIRNAYETGFMSGYPGNRFQPEQFIPREQVLVALANGLGKSAKAPVSQVLGYYSDEFAVSDFARAPIAAATEDRMVVNYPNLNLLNPTRNATRAEVAAMLYQALVSEGQAGTIASSYIVSPTPIASSYKIPAGTVIPVSYEQDRIVLMPEETVPVAFDLRTNITAQDGQLLIPANSKVIGELRPNGNGTRFVAQELLYPDGKRVPFSATSQTIVERQSIGRDNNSAREILRNAAIGSGAAAVIAGVTGDRTIEVEEVLAGTGAGLLASLVQRVINRGSAEVIVVEPETDLNLTLNSDFSVVP
ncbi:MAG: S-layer homology domain-containing protein [Spirulinaceae cyanobacterium SM2_1_0]|nr:S-layer homology domain-containing protein [Spirulinaceae cyanobacterium SM2_1_0]